MKTMKSMFMAILMAAAMFAMTAPAHAFKSDVEFLNNSIGSQYSPDFAPNSCASVSLGTKGYTNVSLAGVTGYKFWFTVTSSAAASTGMVKLAPLTAWSNTGTVRLASEHFSKGKAVTSVGFAAYSSATPSTVTYCLQGK